jgi:hypothetical protein
MTITMTTSPGPAGHPLTMGPATAPVAAPSPGDPAAALLAAVRDALTGAGVPEAPSVPPAGHPGGFSVSRLATLGPLRAIVKWHSAPEGPGAGEGLARCRDALHDSGFRTTPRFDADGQNLAVWPKATGTA